MASRCRLVRGNTRKMLYPASASHPYEKGDLLFYIPGTGYLQTASELPVQDSDEHVQLYFAEYFVGVADTKNGLQSGEWTAKQNQNFQAQGLVCTDGEFEYDCPAQNFAPGALVGIYTTGGYVTDSQKVDALKGNATPSAAIAIAMPQTGALQQALVGTMNRIVIELRPAANRGGVPVAGTYTGTSGS